MEVRLEVVTDTEVILLHRSAVDLVQFHRAHEKGQGTLRQTRLDGQTASSDVRVQRVRLRWH